MNSQSLARPTGHPIAELSNRLAERIGLRRKRKGFLRLLDLDDRMLNDIGVTRWEVEHASQLPFWVDAGTELRRMSLARRNAMM